jgi:phosphate transport system permease protein
MFRQNSSPSRDQPLRPAVSDARLLARHRKARIGQWLFIASTFVGVLALTTLLLNVVNGAFGFVAIENKIEPQSLSINGVALEDLPKDELVSILEARVSAGLFRRLERDLPFAERTRDQVYDLVLERVVEPTLVKSWPLSTSLLFPDRVRSEAALASNRSRLEFRSWLNPRFLVMPQSSTALDAGVRTALLGSLWIIVITIAAAFPVGVAAAIYLEEYASDSMLNRAIRTNISNLAGVPSIIYGMLGLATFVRALRPLTSGALVGAEAAGGSGRTILSAGFTLALLVLPLIIINAQEALRAVPSSLRQASYGLGATRWQTIQHHVLPNAMPGILTGTILAISRAMGETAPVVVVGAATFIDVDPTGPFSVFTTLPIQIYQWTSRPQAEFRSVAAAAILVLLMLLLSLTATAVVLRGRFSRRLV